MLVSYALVTLDNTKLFLDITSDSKNSLIEMLINQATDYIENYCNGRRFVETTYTQEEFDGSGIKTIRLPQFPVTSFSLLEVNNNTNNTDNWSEVNSDEYWVGDDTGIITKTSVFAKGTNRYRATFDAGYTTIPYDLQYVCMYLVSETMNKRKSAGIKSESLGDHSVTFESIMQTNSRLKKILSNYRDIEI